MDEMFLQFLWKYKKFRFTNLRTTKGKEIEIIEGGFQNHHQGPDFLNAKIIIDSQTWVGNIEVHYKSSYWEKHNHHTDSAYNSVILHVVYEEDKEINLPNGDGLPCLELRSKFSPLLLEQYFSLIHGNPWIPCQKQLEENPRLFEKVNLYAKAVDRVSEKVTPLWKDYQNCGCDWPVLVWRHLFKNFGIPHNAQPFESLSIMFSYKHLRKLINQEGQIRVVLLGLAGLLPKKEMPEFKFLCLKLGITESDEMQWKRKGVYPASYPEVRIVQLAAFLELGIFNDFLKLSLSGDTYKKVTKALKSKLTIMSEKPPGEDFLNSFLINALVPLFFFQGQKTGDSHFQEKAIELLESTPFEINKITRPFKKYINSNKTGLISQGVIHLKKEWCDKRKCLFCGLGYHIINEKD